MLPVSPMTAGSCGTLGQVDGDRRGGHRVLIRQPESSGDTGSRKRRAAADEPLAAARELRTSGRPDPRARRGRFARVSQKYGWRLYALPVLLAVTVLVIVQAVHGSGGGTRAAPPDRNAVAEHGPGAATLTGDTARLPDGGTFARHGAGAWRVVPGKGKKVGTGGKLYTYSIAVEDGIPAAQYGGDGGFAKLVQATLSDSRSWTGSGKVTLQRVGGSTTAPSGGDKPDFEIALTTPDTVHRLCGNQIHYESSCYTESTGIVAINLARWVRGAVAFNGDIGTYREYAINHEVGHALGDHHVGCRQNGGLAPVMMQQTFGVSDDFVYRINQKVVNNAKAVPKDGKVCRPNAWPILGSR